MRYLIVIEKAGENYSAYAPDVDGCIAAADTVEATVQLMKEALEFHLESFPEDGLTIPDPVSQHAYVEVTIPGGSG